MVHVTLVKPHVNAEVRWNEHNDPTKISEPLKHLNINHCFIWAVISNTQKLLRPERTGLNGQKNFERQFHLEMKSHRAINNTMLTP